MNKINIFTCVLTIISSVFARNWENANGPYGAEIRKMAIDSIHPDTLYATGNGLYRSFDGGENWIEVSPPIVGNIESDVSVDTKNPNVIYYGSKSLFKSYDYGATWQQIGFQDRDVIVIKVDPVESQNIYVGLDNTARIICPACNYFSADNRCLFTGIGSVGNLGIFIGSAINLIKINCLVNVIRSAAKIYGCSS